MNNTDTRIIDLEEQVAHQTKTIEELSEALSRQWNQIDQLERRLNALTQRFLALEETATPAPEITRPPHY